MIILETFLTLVIMRKTSWCASASHKESIEIRLKLERAALSKITVDLKIEVSLNKHVTYYQLTCIKIGQD